MGHYADMTRHRPVLVTPATALPVTLEQVKKALRIDGDDLDDEITSQIRAAVQHYEGWTGVLGIVIAEQTWSQTFDGFCRDLYLPLGPVIDLDSVTWRNAAGQVSTVPTVSRALRTDAGGRTSVRFDRDWSFPSDLHESEAVKIQYRAGWAAAAVPEDIKAAIKLRVQKALDEAARSNWDVLNRAEHELIGKYRRLSI